MRSEAEQRMQLEIIDLQCANKRLADACKGAMDFILLWRDRLPAATPDLVKACRNAIASAGDNRTVHHLEALTAIGCDRYCEDWDGNRWHECVWCKGRRTAEVYGHRPDCPYVAAKAFLEG
jgi:hypothetical protein